jgi:hypothetical protein
MTTTRRFLGMDLDHRSTRSFPLWFGTLAPPLAWAAHLVAGDLIFELFCSGGARSPDIVGIPLRTAALIETAAFAGVCLLAGALAFGALRRLRREEEGPGAVTLAFTRARAMAVAGLILSALFLLIIVFGFFPSLVLAACTRSL